MNPAAYPAKCVYVCTVCVWVCERRVVEKSSLDSRTQLWQVSWFRIGHTQHKEERVQCIQIKTVTYKYQISLLLLTFTSHQSKLLYLFTPTWLHFVLACTKKTTKRDKYQAEMEETDGEIWPQSDQYKWLESKLGLTSSIAQWTILSTSKSGQDNRVAEDRGWFNSQER